jgi:hypothetical protein
MPGLDFRQLRADVSMAEVLELLGFVVLERKGDQVRGECRSMNLPTLENTDPSRPISAETCSGASSAEPPATILTFGPRQARNLFMKQLSISAFA